MLKPEGVCALIIALIGIGLATGIVFSAKGATPAFLTFTALGIVFMLGGIFGKSME